MLYACFWFIETGQHRHIWHL